MRRCAILVGWASLCALVTPTAPASAAGCANETVRTEATSLALPDCRAYESVSPVNAPDEVYVPDVATNSEKGAFLSLEPFELLRLG